MAQSNIIYFSINILSLRRVRKRNIGAVGDTAKRRDRLGEREQQRTWIDTMRRGLWGDHFPPAPPVGMQVVKASSTGASGTRSTLHPLAHFTIAKTSQGRHNFMMTNGESEAQNVTPSARGRAWTWTWDGVLSPCSSPLCASSSWLPGRMGEPQRTYWCMAWTIVFPFLPRNLGSIWFLSVTYSKNTHSCSYSVSPPRSTTQMKHEGSSLNLNSSLVSESKFSSCRESDCPCLGQLPTCVTNELQSLGWSYMTDWLCKRVQETRLSEKVGD